MKYSWRFWSVLFRVSLWLTSFVRIKIDKGFHLSRISSSFRSWSTFCSILLIILMHDNTRYPYNDCVFVVVDKINTNLSNDSCNLIRIIIYTNYKGHLSVFNTVEIVIRMEKRSPFCIHILSNRLLHCSFAIIRSRRRKNANYFVIPSKRDSIRALLLILIKSRRFQSVSFICRSTGRSIEAIYKKLSWLVKFLFEPRGFVTYKRFNIGLASCLKLN